MTRSIDPIVIALSEVSRREKTRHQNNETSTAKVERGPTQLPAELGSTFELPLHRTASYLDNLPRSLTEPLTNTRLALCMLHVSADDSSWSSIPPTWPSGRDHVCAVPRCFSLRKRTHQSVAINWSDARRRVLKGYREWLRAVCYWTLTLSLLEPY